MSGFFLPISTDVVFRGLKVGSKENQFTNNEESIQESNQAASQAVGLWKALEKEDDSNFQLSALLLPSKGAKRNLESSQFAKTPSCLIIQAFWCSKLVNS